MSNEQSVEQPEKEAVGTAEEEAQQAEEARAGGDAPAPGNDGAGEGDRAVPAEEMDVDTLRAALAEAEERVRAAEEKAQEHWDRLLRTEAEKENARKRAERDAEKARRYAVENFANELLAVRDSLELGLEAARQEESDVEKIREGTELTHRMLTQAMEKFDIEEINPVGEKFNPDLHQAMSMQEVEGQETNTVISVMQKGYKLGDRLLRPALVMVAK